jgi:hypothetical protein
MRRSKKFRTIDNSLVMYKDSNKRYVVVHRGHVVVRSFNLNVADKTFCKLGGK